MANATLAVSSNVATLIGLAVAAALAAAA